VLGYKEGRVCAHTLKVRKLGSVSVRIMGGKKEIKKIHFI